MPERSQFELERDAQRKVSRDLLAQKAASSRPGQVYHTMTSLADRMTRPGYQGAQADVDQLKGLRRDWNRNQKYTPMGMQVSGATTPGGAQDIYMDMSRALRQGNKPAYNKMYPLTGGFMDYAEKGGMWGAMLSGLARKTLKKGKDYLSGTGLASILADEPEEDKERYITETFGPHLEDVPYGGPPPYEYEGPWPHPEELEEPSLMTPPLEEVKTREEQIQELVDEKQRQIDNFETTASSDILDAAIESQWPTKDPVVFDDYVSDRLQRLRDSGGEPKDDISKYEDYIDRGNVAPPAIDYSDDYRTDRGIANLMPGGALHDRIPWKQRLNMRIAEEMQRRGPHRNEPRTSYYGANWYDEYKRKMENEMEIAKGIRSPIDR